MRKRADERVDAARSRSPVSLPERDPESIEAAAASWLAREDRGFTADEQDRFLEWLRADRRNGEAVARLRDAWSRLDRLRDVTRADATALPVAFPAPAARHGGRRFLRYGTAVAAAAAVVVAAFWSVGQRQPAAGPQAPATVHGACVLPGAERRLLEDGTAVELAPGASMTLAFSADERRVQLRGGDALFTVAKNPARPFVVEARGVEARALGTAFAVGFPGEGVSVLVTEGEVRLEQPEDKRGRAAATGTVLVPSLRPGQEARVLRNGAAQGNSPVEVRDLGPEEIDAALAWRGIRLEFDDLPLDAVVSAFNHYNARKLVIADDETAAITVGGSFRADNVEAFIRLLDTGFGVSSEAHEGAIVLRRRP